MPNCDVCNRYIHKSKKTHGYKLCIKHYNQFKKYNKFLDNNPRTIYDKNSYTIKGNVTYIDLYDINCNKVATTLIDTEDLPRVKNIKWNLNHAGYANNRNKHDSKGMLHRYILNTTEFVDHINHNKLDNRKCNLRIVTKSQNAMNSNHKGVTQYGDRYTAYIKLNGKQCILGKFSDIEEALYARWYAEKLVFKEYAYKKDKPIILEQREKDIQELVYRKVQRLDISV